MTDLGKNRGGPKESDNRDKSLHGLMVAFAMADAIAGSAILFAYASSDQPLDAAGTATSEAPAPEPEPIIVEKVVEKPVYIERIKYINQTVEVEKPVYINRTIEVEKEVPVYIYINNTEYDSQKAAQPKPDEREDKHEEKDNDLSDEQDVIPERLQSLLDEIVDFDDGEDEKEDMDDDDENKGKGHKHDDDD
jgi:hypothetical protein